MLRCDLIRWRNRMVMSWLTCHRKIVGVLNTGVWRVVLLLIRWSIILVRPVSLLGHMRLRLGMMICLLLSPVIGCG